MWSGLSCNVGGAFHVWANRGKMGENDESMKERKERGVKRTREEKKKDLMEEAEGLIDELLDWDEGAGAPTLTEIEDAVLELRQRMGRRMAEEVLGGQEAKESVPGPVCAECQREMRYRGNKEREVESRLGGIELDRGYYYCDHCGVGFFPPG
jgi:hypothetical protein